jgi:hypothetical protein
MHPPGFYSSLRNYLECYYVINEHQFHDLFTQENVKMLQDYVEAQLNLYSDKIQDTEMKGEVEKQSEVKS